MQSDAMEADAIQHGHVIRNNRLRFKVIAEVWYNQHRETDTYRYIRSRRDVAHSSLKA